MGFTIEAEGLALLGPCTRKLWLVQFSSEGALQLKRREVQPDLLGKFSIPLQS